LRWGDEKNCRFGNDCAFSHQEKTIRGKNTNTLDEKFVQLEGAVRESLVTMSEKIGSNCAFTDVMEEKLVLMQEGMTVLQKWMLTMAQKISVMEARVEEWSNEEESEEDDDEEGEEEEEVVKEVDEEEEEDDEDEKGDSDDTDTSRVEEEKHEEKEEEKSEEKGVGGEGQNNERRGQRNIGSRS
jgi:hypothetical protein